MPPSTYTPYANPPDNIPYPSSSTRVPVPHGLIFLCTGLLALGLWYTLDHFSFWEYSRVEGDGDDMEDSDGSDGEGKTNIVVVFDDEVEIREAVKEFLGGWSGEDGEEEQRGQEKEAVLTQMDVE